MTSFHAWNVASRRERGHEAGASLASPRKGLSRCRSPVCTKRSISGLPYTSVLALPTQCSKTRQVSVRTGDMEGRLCVSSVCVSSRVLLTLRRAMVRAMVRRLSDSAGAIPARYLPCSSSDGPRATSGAQRVPSGVRDPAGQPRLLRSDERDAAIAATRELYDAIPGPFQILSVPIERSPSEHLDWLSPVQARRVSS